MSNLGSYGMECDPLQKASDLKKFDRWRVSYFCSRLHTILEQPSTQIPQVQAWLLEAGLPFKATVRLISLEDVFISVVDQRQRGLDVPVD